MIIDSIYALENFVKNNNLEDGDIELDIKFKTREAKMKFEQGVKKEVESSLTLYGWPSRWDEFVLYGIRVRLL